MLKKDGVIQSYLKNYRTGLSRWEDIRELYSYQSDASHAAQLGGWERSYLARIESPCLPSQAHGKGKECI